MKITYEKKEILKKELDAFLEIFDCLSDDEYRFFSSFLKSPFFNKEDTVINLFDRLRMARSKSSSNIRGKDLIRKIYGEEEEEPGVQKLGDGLKKLEQLLLKFITHTALEKDDKLAQRQLTIGLKKRKNTELFYRAAARYEKTLQEEPVTIMRLNEEWWLDHQRYFHQNLRQNRLDIKWFQSSDQKLDQFTLLTKLRYICESYNRNNVLDEGFTVNIPSHLLEKLSPESHTPEVIWLYERIVPLVEQSYERMPTRKYLHHFINKHHKLGGSDKIVLAKLLYNVLLRGINLDDGDQTVEMMVRLSKFIAQKEIYLFEDVISDDEYLNIAIMSGVGGAYKFQSYFIEAYVPFLEEDKQERAYRFAQVYRHFHRTQFSEAIAGLKALFPPNTQGEDKYMLRAKALLLRAYVGLYLDGNYGCYEDYIRADDNFRHFLARHEGLNARYYDTYRNMALMCMTIVQARNQHQYGPEVVRATLEKLDELKSVIGRSWLRQQILRLGEKGKFG